MIRIVKMHFQDTKTGEFINLFREVYPLISTFPGCLGLELIRDIDNPAIFFTYSRWDVPESLEAYRSSALFIDTWRKTKVLFEHKAEAWSVDKVYPSI
jgi:heme-degrading monooxygenase HmoA